LNKFKNTFFLTTTNGVRAYNLPVILASGYIRLLLLTLDEVVIGSKIRFLFPVLVKQSVLGAFKSIAKGV
jgi:hypothetical protein